MTGQISTLQKEDLMGSQNLLCNKSSLLLLSLVMLDGLSLQQILYHSHGRLYFQIRVVPFGIAPFSCDLCRSELPPSTPISQ
jgi:hypothetical protein